MPSTTGLAELSHQQFDWQFVVKDLDRWLLRGRFRGTVDPTRKINPLTTISAIPGTTFVRSSKIILIVTEEFNNIARDDPSIIYTSNLGALRAPQLLVDDLEMFC